MPSPPAVLSPTELAGYRLTLERRLATLAGEITGDRDKLDADLKDEHHQVLDRKDQADQSIRAGIDDAEFARDLAESRDVRAALERLAAGRYGLCLACGEPIGRERLAVQPAAARCAACQASFERAPARRQGASS
jgi:DnaK suppressor protein